MDCSMPGSSVLHYLPEFPQIHVHWVSDANYPSHPLLIPSPFAFSLSQNQGLFQCISSSNQVAKVSISPSNGYSGLISFRIDWFDLLAVQETLKSLLQHHNSKASILRCSAFFMVQLSHPYMTTGKTIALSIQTFVRNMMSLLLNILSKSVIAFLPRSKHLLISWFQFTPEHPQKPLLSLAGGRALSMSKTGWQADHPKTKFWSRQSLFTKWGTLECFQCQVHVLHSDFEKPSSSL